MNRIKKIRIKFFIFFVFIVLVYIVFFEVIPTLSRYYCEVTAGVIGYGLSNYTITYNLNGGTNPDEQIYSFCSRKLPVRPFNPIRSGYAFRGWYTDSGFNGSPITDITIAQNYTLYANWIEGTAEANGIVYTSLQEAINAVPTDGTETTVKLLKNVSEVLEISSGQNIVFDLQNYEISNSGSNNVIKNYGTLVITNGLIKSTAAQGIINNHGNLTVTGNSRIIATGTATRQAVYNSGGNLTISGNAFLQSGSNSRATVQTLTSGTITITGGTIISTGFYAVYNENSASSCIIGIKDGNSDRNLLNIQGQSYGVYSLINFNFYDGKIKGKTKAIYDESKLFEIENTFKVARSEETIDGNVYKVAYLANTKTIIFNATGGTVDESTRYIESGSVIGTLPIPRKNLCMFVGWFTNSDGGTEITSSEVITENNEYFAHWVVGDVAMVNDNYFDSIQKAINSITNTTQQTVNVLKSTSEHISIPSRRNIILNLSNYTLSNASNDTALIVNNGTLNIINGTILQNGTQAAIDNFNSGIINISGGNILSNGGKGAVYSSSTGSINISGNAYLCSNASGIINGGKERGTVTESKETGCINITGGTIESTEGVAVSAYCPLSIGISNDGNISTVSPKIIGYSYGIRCSSDFKFYDGIIKGIEDAYLGSITEQEQNTQIITGSETINGENYITKHLEILE